MKRTTRLLSGTALALALASAPAASAGVAPLAAIQGTWAIGSIQADSSYNVGAGTLTFDGNGGVTGFLSYNYDSEYCVNMPVSGTYNVNPGKLSATATMTVTTVTTGTCAGLGDDETLTLAISLGNNLKTFYFTEIDPKVEGNFIYSEGYALAGVGTHF
jgi:hypothetical protein